MQKMFQSKYTQPVACTCCFDHQTTPMCTLQANYLLSSHRLNFTRCSVNIHIRTPQLPWFSTAAQGPENRCSPYLGHSQFVPSVHAKTLKYPCRTSRFLVPDSSNPPNAYFRPAKSLCQSTTSSGHPVPHMGRPTFLRCHDL